MRLQLLLALKLSSLIGLVAAVGEGDACARYDIYNCDTEDEFDAQELALLKELGYNEDDNDGIDVRAVDFSDIDEDAGVNITSIVHRRDLQDLDGVELNAKVAEILGGLGVDSSSDDDLVKRFELQTRGNAETKHLCKDDAKMAYKLPKYPKGNLLFDNEKWSDCDNFKLSDPPLPGSTSPQKNRKHHDEHILEKNMPQGFATEILAKEGDPQNPTIKRNTMCHYLDRYWTKGMGNKLNQIDNVVAWDVIGAAWPKDDGNGKKEIVRLDSRINGLKTTLFQVGTAITNEKTTRKNMEDIKTVGRVVAKLKLGILLVKYLDHPDINKIYFDQAKRVQDAFELVENQLVINFKDEQPPYVKVDLSLKWINWMNKYTDDLNKKMGDWLKLWTDGMKQHIKNGKDSGVDKMDKNRKTLQDRMEAVVKEVDSLLAKPVLFKNPFK